MPGGESGARPCWWPRDREEGDLRHTGWVEVKENMLWNNTKIAGLGVGRGGGLDQRSCEVRRQP